MSTYSYINHKRLTAPNAKNFYSFKTISKTDCNAFIFHQLALLFFRNNFIDVTFKRFEVVAYHRFRLIHLNRFFFLENSFHLD